MTRGSTSTVLSPNQAKWYAQTVRPKVATEHLPIEHIEATAQQPAVQTAGRAATHIALAPRLMLMRSRPTHIQAARRRYQRLALLYTRNVCIK